MIRYATNILILIVLMVATTNLLTKPKPVSIEIEYIYPEAHPISWHLKYANWGNNNDRTKLSRGARQVPFIIPEV